jgi:putative ABC transport system permease protein
MYLLRKLASGLRSLFRKQQVSKELDEELDSFAEMATEGKIREGMTRDQAVRTVRIERGNLEVAKDHVYAARWESVVEGVWRDISFGVRSIRKSPGFSAIVVLTLTLGIGATTAIFSVVYAVLLHVPYSQPAELVAITEKGPATKPNEISEVSPGDFTDWQEQAPVFTSIAGYQAWEFHALTRGGGDPDEVWVSPVTLNLFQVLGVNAFLGRSFAPNETSAVILSNHYWRSHFLSDPKILGRVLALDGKLYSVVGIAPADFEFPTANTQMWTPLILSGVDRANHKDRKLSIVARLRQAVTMQQAQAFLDAAQARLAAQYPETNAGWSALVIPFRTPGVQGILRDTILALLGAVIFMLMIVCANVASMLLARGTTRHGEMAVRAALGAARSRLVRQLMLESVLLAVAAGIGGLMLARLGLAGIVSLVPKYNLVETQALNHISMNLAVFGFAATLSLLTGIGVGLLPALRGSRIDISEWLKEHGRASIGVRGTRLQSGLVTCEIAFALVLLLGAGLMVQSFRRLSTTPTGFNPDHLLTVRVPLMKYKYSPSQSADFYRGVLERIRAIPGIKSAGLANNLPFTGFHLTLAIPSPPESPGGPSGTIGVAGRSISPGYFQAMGTPFIDGRDFIDAENQSDAPCVRIVNQTMARLYWPGKDAVGQQLSGVCPKKGAASVIVGVVADSKQESVTSQAQPELYEPYAQHPFASFLVTFAIRTTSNPLDVAIAVRQAVQQVDNDQPVIQLRTMQEVISESIWRQHVSASILGLLSVLALLLAAVGIYGVIAYSISLRTHEFGIRSALGATKRDVLELVLRQGLYLTLIGLVAGIILSLGLTRLLRSLLFGVSPTDVVTFAAVIMLLVITAVLACYIPARRAANVDPMTALRYE